jgi:glucosamine-6-phosphate deaminase
MRLIRVNDYNEMSRKAANIIASQITLKSDSVLGLATGDTPLGMYNELIKLYNKKELDFADVKSFNLDEYCGLDIKNSQSYYYFMMNNFFKHINLPLDNINIPNGNAESTEECLRYERKIKEAGGIDIQVLGIGVNGHIGFNEPDINFEAKTHLVTLDKTTIESNSRFFKNINEVPTKAITMGIGTIMNSKKIVLLAYGNSKADIIAKAINGKITSEVPASILQLHQDVTVIIDEAAAVNL